MDMQMKRRSDGESVNTVEKKRDLSLEFCLLFYQQFTSSIKMLAVFHSKVAAGPLELTVKNATDSPDSRRKGIDIVNSFRDSHPNSISTQFGQDCAMAYTHDKQALLRPRSLAVADDIFCLFEGNLENLAQLRQQYGIVKNTSEVYLVIELYRALRDRAPYPADQIVRGLNGSFAFVLYDHYTRSVFVAADCYSKVPFFWGTTSDGSLAFSDDANLLKQGCGKSFAPFPAGCFFSTSGGLQSFEHPLSPVKGMPRVDSEGQFCGATFKVDPPPQISSPLKSTWAAAF